MLYVALGLVVALAIVSVSFLSIIRWLVRQQVRERDLLVNQLCNLAGRPWQEPPAWHEPATEPELELAYIATPEQLPE